MPDIPLRYTDPKSLAAERAKKANSPLYWVHGSVTVYAYKQMSRAEQDAVNQECRAIERAKQQDTKKPAC